MIFIKQIHLVYFRLGVKLQLLEPKRWSKRRCIMVVSTLMYVMLVISGLLGGAIAWDDLHKKGKSGRKVEPEAK